MGMPLEGVRILDWTMWQHGPVAGAMLADLGAEVIKIEQPVVGDYARGPRRIRGQSALLPAGRNYYFENNNRNKKGITLDLKKEKGKEVLFRLVEKSDVFMHNFRKSVADRLGISYEVLSRHNPRLIYATANGYGQKGPESDDPAFDYVGLARSGIMHMVAEPRLSPIAPTGGLADQMGAIMFSYGILAALVARQYQGVGQEVSTSMLGGMITLQGMNFGPKLLLGHVPPPFARGDQTNPLFNHYKCSDGRWVAIAHLQPDRVWPNFCRALGVEPLEKDPRFDTAFNREQNRQECIATLDQVFVTAPLEEWLQRLRKEGIPCTPVATIEDVIKDPQVIANEYIVDFDHPDLGRIKLWKLPMHFSKTPAVHRLPAPELGQHTEEILLEVGGYTWDEIVELREQGVL